MAFDKNTVVTGFLTRLTTRVNTDAAPASHVGSTGSSHGVASTTNNGFMSSTDKTKLDGISAGAQVNAVTSVASKTGAVTLTKTDVGLGNVDNTADVNKIVSAAAKLSTARTISLSGDVTGSTTFDGSGNVSITATVLDDSHNHSNATASTNGFMSSTDKTKLDGLSNYTLPVASTTTLGGVKAGTNISIDANGVISANDTSVGWSEITSKPTTLAGYGITDAAALKGTDTVYGGAKFSLSGTTLTITTI